MWSFKWDERGTYSRARYVLCRTTRRDTVQNGQLGIQVGLTANTWTLSSDPLGRLSSAAHSPSSQYTEYGSPGVLVNDGPISQWLSKGNLNAI